MQVAPTPVHRAPIGGSCAWTADSFPDSSVWTYRIPEKTLDLIDQAIREHGTCPPFVVNGVDVAQIREILRHERGFVILRGVPVDRYTPDQLDMIYAGLCEGMVGATLPQNVKGELMYSVRDEGYQISRDYGRVGVRFSKTTEPLNFHTDSAPALMGNTPDVVGLFALEVARSGGESALVSAVTAHNVLLRENPAALERLYQPYHFDRSAEWRPGEPRTFYAPVFTYDEQAGLAVRHFRFYIPKGHEIAGVPLTEEDVAALDALDAVLARPELQVRFHMQRGDIQLVSNVFVLHARTGFEDFPEPERKRHLKRLWLRFGGDSVTAP